MLIGIDGDGVLLNYNEQVSLMYEEHTGKSLVVCEDNAYHYNTRFGIDPIPFEDSFWDTFGQEGWKSMPVMEGALEACQLLVEQGHTLVCVTSMPKEFEQDRLLNLQMHGFPIEKVVACSGKFKNPKKEAIETLGVDFFIDDEVRKLEGLSCGTGLVEPNCPDSPNVGKDTSFVDIVEPNLLCVAKRLVGLDTQNGYKKRLSNTNGF